MATAPDLDPAVLPEPEAVRFLCGDARAVLDGLPEKSVHCCITSPSYYWLRDYGHPGQLGHEATPQEYVAALVEVFQAVRRVLRDDGLLWIVLGDSYANNTKWGGNGSSPTSKNWTSGRGGYGGQKVKRTTGLKPKEIMGIPWRTAFALQDDGWLLRADIIWSKANPMPESVRDRPTRSHEYIFMFAKQSQYFYDQDAIREPHAYGMNGGRFSTRYRAAQLLAQNGSLNVEQTMNPAGRNKRSVWTVATKPFSSKKYGVETEHYAAFPAELIRPMVKASTSEYGVCDVCGAPYRRQIERQSAPPEVFTQRNAPTDEFIYSGSRVGGVWRGQGQKLQNWRNAHPPQTVGWQQTCACEVYELRPDLTDAERDYVAQEMARHG